MGVGCAGGSRWFRSLCSRGRDQSSSCVRAHRRRQGERDSDHGRRARARTRRLDDAARGNVGPRISARHRRRVRRENAGVPLRRGSLTTQPPWSTAGQCCKLLYMAFHYHGNGSRTRVCPVEQKLRYPDEASADAAVAAADVRLVRYPCAHCSGFHVAQKRNRAPGYIRRHHSTRPDLRWTSQDGECATPRSPFAVLDELVDRVDA
jgi:hypothetical protein